MHSTQSHTRRLDNAHSSCLVSACIGRMRSSRAKGLLQQRGQGSSTAPRCGVTNCMNKDTRCARYIEGEDEGEGCRRDRLSDAEAASLSG